ncbi:hypothetical protein CC86DRAFT_283308, partial [Ophiobolus disseminans]
ITFLRNYTDPVLESVSDAFALSEAHAEPAEELSTTLPRPTNNLYDECIDDLFSGVFLDICGEQSTVLTGPTPTLIVPASSQLPQRRVEAIISLLEAQYKPNSDTMACPTDQTFMDMAKTVFTVNNIVEYVSAFFTFFNPHALLIHQPSFNIDEVSLPLMLAISLLGTIFCTPQDHALSARYFFDLTEEYVFGLLHAASICNNLPSYESLQLVQAAFLIHALQMNSNHEEVRLRIRVHRFPAIVASMRRLDLFGFVRTAYHGPADWEQYIIDEVKIRLAHRVFVTDCMLTLLFKSPPQITITEMCGEMPSADAIFEASTSAVFLDLATALAPTPPHARSLKDLTSIFLHEEDWVGLVPSTWVSVGSEFLVTLIFAIHSLIFVSRSGLLTPSTHQVLLRATSRWKGLWHLVQTRAVSSRKRPIGFEKYGLELWWLAVKILELAQSGDTQTQYMKSTPTDNLKQLHNFIQQHANG